MNQEPGYVVARSDTSITESPAQKFEPKLKKSIRYILIVLGTFIRIRFQASLSGIRAEFLGRQAPAQGPREKDTVLISASAFFVIPIVKNRVTVNFR